MKMVNKMSRTIKVSDETYLQLKNEKEGDATFDDVINRWRIAKEMLPVSAKEVLEVLDTSTERGVFLAGLIYHDLTRKEKYGSKKILDQIKILSPENFGKVYSMIVNKVHESGKEEKYESLLEMASMELLKGGIDKMNSEDMRYVFTLGQTLTLK